jgi:adenosylcobinamide-phosphate synthase
MRDHALALLVALLLDLALGDRENLPHPVRWMGACYAWGDGFFRKAHWRGYETGLLTVLFIGGVFALVPWFLLGWVREGWPHLLVEGFLLYWCLSVRTLADEARRVWEALQAQCLPEARRLLARVVGRDTQKLAAAEIARGVVETLGESWVDGFLSPLFWGLLLGVPGAFFFKAVSTGDSMIGHPEEPYRRFGWAAARLDDALNWIPARLSILILVPAGLLSRLSVSGLWRAFWADRLKHASPNAAHGEAAFAGALGVKLGGINYYGGKVYRQTLLNPSGRVCEAKDILRGISFLWMAAMVSGVILLVLALVVH